MQEQRIATIVWRGKWLILLSLVLSIAIMTLPIPQTHAIRSAAASGEILGSPLAYVGSMIRRFFRDARRLLAIPTLAWLIASTTAMAFAAGGYNAWLKEFLVRYKGMSDAQATELLVMALCGGLSGILVGGRVSDRLRAKMPAGPSARPSPIS